MSRLAVVIILCLILVGCAGSPLKLTPLSISPQKVSNTTVYVAEAVYSGGFFSPSMYFLALFDSDGKLLSAPYLNVQSSPLAAWVQTAIPVAGQAAIVTPIMGELLPSAAATATVKVGK